MNFEGVGIFEGGRKRNYWEEIVGSKENIRLFLFFVFEVFGI